MDGTPQARFDYVLVGGGLATSLIALALFQQRPGARVAIVEQQTRLGGNHLWCFHAGDVAAAEALVQPLVECRWDGYDVKFPELTRGLDEPYAAVPSDRLDRVVQRAFAERPHCQLFLGRRAERVTATSVELSSGEQLSAQVVIESRGPAALPTPGGTGYQKFVGLELELERPSPLTRPLLMDALVEQRDGFRFMYGLPLGRQRVLLEDTYFSDTSALDHARLEAEILAYAERHRFAVRGVARREHGVLPLPIASPPLPEPAADEPLKAGYQGGWFHPVTGYSFPVAVRLALAVAGCAPAELRTHVWRALLRQQRSQLRFGTLLNRMLFTAFASHERHHAIARFYRLPPASIRRFYALDLTRTDRLRIVCGRPPRGFSLPLALRAGRPSAGALA
jgi:lycopene beta-cyclase